MKNSFEEGDAVMLIPQYAAIFLEKGNRFDLNQRFTVKKVDGEQLWVDGLDGPHYAKFFQRV